MGSAQDRVFLCIEAVALHHGKEEHEERGPGQDSALAAGPRPPAVPLEVHLTIPLPVTYSAPVCPLLKAVARAAHQAPSGLQTHPAQGSPSGGLVEKMKENKIHSTEV